MAQQITSSKSSPDSTKYKQKRLPKSSEEPPSNPFFPRGVGENRTLVQISHQKAFYILSFCFIFFVKLTKNRPLYAQPPLFTNPQQKLTAGSMLTFMVPLYKTPSTRAFQRHLASLPVGIQLKILLLLQIKQQERSYSRHLNF